MWHFMLLLLLLLTLTIWICAYIYHDSHNLRFCLCRSYCVENSQKLTGIINPVYSGRIWLNNRWENSHLRQNIVYRLIQPKENKRFLRQVLGSSVACNWVSGTSLRLSGTAWYPLCCLQPLLAIVGYSDHSSILHVTSWLFNAMPKMELC